MDDFGYHLGCYKKITCLKSRYKKEFDNMLERGEFDNMSEQGEFDNMSEQNIQLSTSQSQTEEETSRCAEVCASIPGASSSTWDSLHQVEKTLDVYTSTGELKQNPITPFWEIEPIAEPWSVEVQVSCAPSSPSEYVPSPSTSTSETEAESQTAPSEKPVTLFGWRKYHKVCIFCLQVEKKTSNKKRQRTSVCSTLETYIKVQSYAYSLNDLDLLERLKNCKNFYYHAICRSIYQQKSIRLTENKKPEDSCWYQLRSIHKQSFDALCAFIDYEVIEKENVYFLQDLYLKYKALLLEMADGNLFESDTISYTAQRLQEKILNQYNNEIIITMSDTTHKRKIVYKQGIDIDNKLLEESIIEKMPEINKREEVAYQLRNSVKSIKKRISEKVYVDDIIQGESEIPELLFEFMCNLIQGPDIRRKNSTDDYVKIKSLCQDIIYIITKGHIKPAKHLMLGLAMKSLTSSRKVLTILNKYGHSVGYTVAEELETKMTYTAYENNKLIPSDICPITELSTHVAFDNYDRSVETFSGKDTLHNTVGIIYQFYPENNAEEDSTTLNQNIIRSNDTSISVTSPDIPTTSFMNPSKSTPWKRRRFEEIPREIQSYYKKPSAKTTLMSTDVISNIIENSKISKKNAIIKDLLWVFSLSLLKSTPMWIGFNSTITSDNSERQMVDYLPQINLSPTSSFSVVHETLLYAQRIAEECNQQQIIVSYDLAIAKMAMQIKMTETPKFDNIFINLGAFHIQMAFFKAIGKYIDACGITDILVQAEVLAEGSVNGFLSSKHFNRCKRIHPLLSGALQILNFEQFMSENNFDVDILTKDLNDLKTNFIEIDESLNIPASYLQETLNSYENFVEEILQGSRGKTAQYYMQYIEFINIYFRFTRSIRTSNFELYLDSLFDIANLFFTFNQSNYARWILQYLCNLIDLKLNKSELLSHFMRGAFGVKRTNNKFSRSPVDLTLKQTINATSFLTGVTHFTNSVSVRQRCALSHSMRTKIISRLFEELKITSSNDTVRELENPRIEKDKKALENIIIKIKENLNPFDNTIECEYLYNISTGRVVSNNTASFLLNANTLGKTKKNIFIEECNIDSSRFEQTIPRDTIHNFAAECIKKTLISKDGKTKVLKMERDIVGRLLAIALEKKVDMAFCLSYPLSPAPPALCHSTGEIFKTDKSKFAEKIKSFIKPSTPTNIDIEIIDGFYFLHNKLGPSTPNRFDKLAEFILKKIIFFSKASEIHIIFDRYFTPSIKDIERYNSHETDRPYEIVGSSQISQNDLIKSLKNKKFKEALVTFLFEQWQNDILISTLGSKKVLITVQEKCFSFVVENNSIKKNEEIDFECFHEDADTRIIYHISKCKTDAKILLNAIDTDALIILLGNIHKFIDSQIWLCSSTKSLDVNYINCKDLAQILGDDLCRSLPAFHAFTGSDYTASFYRKDKVKGFKLLQKCKNVQNVFQYLNNPININNKAKMKILQEFTCLLYGISHCCDVNMARLIIFQKKYATKSNTDQLISDIKSFDSSLIPPCWKSLKQKILRTIYVTSMWQYATDKNCVILDIEQCGWICNDKMIKLRWFEGDPTPLTVDGILIDDNDDDDDDDENLETVDINSDDDE
ncbi:uncharacterized protein [Anoplolepis gracilipes]